jgi:hypothetical protein
MTIARDTHRQLDRAYAESEARDERTRMNNVSSDPPDIARPTRWRKDPTVSGGKSEPKVLLLELVQRTSAKGTIYLTGWMAKARLVGFLAPEPNERGDQVWRIYVQEPQPRETKP